MKKVILMSPLISIMMLVSCSSAVSPSLVEPPSDISVNESDVAPYLPPGDDNWSDVDANNGKTSSVANTVPWTPEELRRVSLPEPVHPSTLRSADGMVLVSGLRRVFVVDPSTGEIPYSLCVKELVCNDGNDDDFLAHMWDPWTDGSHLKVDPQGRWVVFMDAASDEFNNAWNAKVYDLQALSEGNDIDTDTVITFPATNVAPWFSGWWMEGRRIVAWYRRDNNGQMEQVVEVRKVPEGSLDLQKAFVKGTATDDPATIGDFSLPYMLLGWPYAAYLEPGEKRVVLWDISQDGIVWRLPDGAQGAFHADWLRMTEGGVFSAWGDSTTNPERFVYFGFDGTTERFCPEFSAGVLDQPLWTAISRDGRWLVGEEGHPVMIDVAGCEMKEAKWNEIDSDENLVIPRPDGTEPGLQRAAATLNAGLFGYLGDTNASDQTKQHYVLLWPYESASPTARLGPADVQDPVQYRWHIVSGHYIVLLGGTGTGGQVGTQLIIYGDETPPQIGNIELNGSVLSIGVSDGGGPAWKVVLFAVDTDGQETVLEAVRASNETWTIDVSQLPSGTYAARAVAIDLSGNWTAGDALGIEIP